MDWSLQPLESFEALIEEMESESDSSKTYHPLLHPDFMRPVFDNFADGSVFLIAGRERCRLKIFFPINRDRVGTWQTFSPSQLPLAPLYAESNWRWNLDVGELAHFLPGPAILFSVLDFDSEFSASIAAAESQTDRVIYGTTMSIRAVDSFDAYWCERPKKLRDNIRRYFRRAEKESPGGGVTLRINRSVEDIRLALDIYADIESAGWKGRAGTAISGSNAQGHFYHDVLSRFAERGQARIYELLFEDKVVSSRIAILEGSIVVFLKTTFDEQYSNVSPGRLLLYLTIEELLAEGHSPNIEFYTKASRDQLQWATHERDICHLNFYRNKFFKSSIEKTRRVRNRFA